MPYGTDLIAILAGAPTPALESGYLPAARRLASSVLLLTDRPGQHAVAAAMNGVEIVECDVTRPVEVIDRLEQVNVRPGLVFSDSDHLQSSATLVADWFGLPGKDWRVTHRVKNKGIMRRCLARAAIEQVPSVLLSGPDDLPAARTFAFPAVLKPAAGVASEDVAYIADRDDLAVRAGAIWSRFPRRTLVLERFLEGELRTLETLGDGRDVRVLGGYRCTLAPPPGFVVQTMRWRSQIERTEVEAVLERLKALGVNLGACHTEYVVGPEGVRIIEVNYRTIGDGADRLIAEATGFPFHEAVLRLHRGEPLSAIPIIEPRPVFAGLVYQFGPPLPPGDDRDCTYRHVVLSPGRTGPGPRTNRHYTGRVTVIAGDDARLDHALAAIINNDRQDAAA